MKFKNRDIYPILKVPQEISKALSFEPSHEEVFWSWARQQKHGDYSYSKSEKTWTNHKIQFPQIVKPIERNKVITNTKKSIKVGWGLIIKFILFGLLCTFFLVIGQAPFSFWFGFIILYVIGLTAERKNILSIHEATTDTLITKADEEIVREIKRFNEETLQFKKRHDNYLKEIESDKKFIEEQLYWETKRIKEVSYGKSIVAKSSPIRLAEIAKRGKTEIYFLEALNEKFGQNIHCDLGLKAGNEYFKPDFVYHHSEKGICIDIEIDEPYSFSDKLPIHYKNYSDGSRDNYFLSQNWIIIRFTEKQIIESRQECIDFIQECIHCVFFKKDAIDLKISEETKWSYEQALLWAKTDYRNTYLSKITNL